MSVIQFVCPVSGKRVRLTLPAAGVFDVVEGEGALLPVGWAMVAMEVEVDNAGAVADVVKRRADAVAYTLDQVRQEADKPGCAPDRRAAILAGLESGETAADVEADIATTLPLPPATVRVRATWTISDEAVAPTLGVLAGLGFPVVDSPVAVEAPKAEAPKAEAPKVEAPKVEAPALAPAPAPALGSFAPLPAPMPPPIPFAPASEKP